MITIRVSNNSDRYTKIYDENTATPRQAFDECGIDYSVGMPSFDGTMFRAGDLDKTFAELGATNDAVTYKLGCVMKMDNAAA